MRHNGLLLLVCCWLAPGFRQLKKLGIKKTLPSWQGFELIGLLMGEFAPLAMMFAFIL
jgi:hypothetical protein